MYSFLGATEQACVLDDAAASAAGQQAVLAAVAKLRPVIVDVTRFFAELAVEIVGCGVAAGEEHQLPNVIVAATSELPAAEQNAPT